MLDTSRDPVPAPTDAPADLERDVECDVEFALVAEEPRGCLFALSQPPLMIFLAVIGCLLLLSAVHDLFFL
ncbi:hypothetical protein [Streptomyces sp. NPDC003327]